MSQYIKIYFCAVLAFYDCYLCLVKLCPRDGLGYRPRDGLGYRPRDGLGYCPRDGLGYYY